MRINTNMAALNAWRSMTSNGANLSKSLEKLSSGYRINRAADDAAGLAVSEKMRAQIKGTNMAIRNAQDGVSLVQTAEGALTETHSILQRMRELGVQASTGTLNSSDTAAIQEEIDSLTLEITRIGETTKFNDINLLNGTMAVADTGTAQTALNAAVGGGALALDNIEFNGTDTGTYTITAAAGAGGAGVTLDITITDGSGNTVFFNEVANGAGDVELNASQFGISFTVTEDAVAGDITGTTFVVANSASTVQIGANTTAQERLSISINDMTATGLTLTTLDLTTTTNARTAIDTIDTALTAVSTQRAELGAVQNRLEHTVSNLGVTAENLSAAESRIRDVDMASEMANFTKNQILQQASTAMLAQANQTTQGILSLLR